MTDTTTNGGGTTELPAHRAAIAEANAKAFSVEYQRLATDRDALVVERDALKLDLTLAKVAADGMASQLHDAREAAASRIAEMESRCESLIAQRDQAVADCVKWLTSLANVWALLRSLEIPNVPHVRERLDHDTELG